MRYDLLDLQLFLHVVSEGSITAGARRVHLSLPSASARIRALEQHAGMALLVRGRRGVRPTPAGTTLARHAQDVLAEVARLDGAVAGYTRAPAAAPLVLLSGSSAMYRLVPRALAGFLRAHPDLDVTVSERQSPDTVAALLAGEADLGVVLEDLLPGSGLDAEPLGDDSLVVVGERGGILAGRTGVTYREAAEHPLVGLTAESPLQRSIEGHLGPNAPVARHRTLVGDLGTLVVLASAGVGLAVVPRHVVPGDGTLEVCELEEPWSRRRLALCRGETARKGSDATAALAEHLRLAARGSAVSRVPRAG
ncbi:MAG: LysR family transcriptional regulator [Pseudonocardia sp.]|nr:LysR family transcriptional regulator [Pseudonocardia sp.]